MHDPRLGRFFAVDPIDHLYSDLSPYQHSNLNPVWMLEIEGLERRKFQTVQKRSKPIFNDNFSGGGLISVFGGSRGKYTKHNSLSFHKNYTPEISHSLPDFGDDPRNLQTGDNSNLTQSNPLERVYHSEDMDLNNRLDLVPRFGAGELTIDFDPGTDDDGQGVERTYQLGKVDKDGNETIISQTTTDKPGKISTDFELKPGEVIFKREIGPPGVGGKSTTSATKKSEPQDDGK